MGFGIAKLCGEESLLLGAGIVSHTPRVCETMSRQYVYVLLFDAVLACVVILFVRK